MIVLRTLDIIILKELQKNKTKKFLDPADANIPSTSGIKKYMHAHNL